MKNNIRTLICTLTVLLCCIPAVFADEGTHHLVNQTLPLWSIIPFVGMLLSIAIIPLVKPDWWGKNMLLVALGWSLVFLVPFAIAYGLSEAWFRLLESVLLDYIPFIVLLFGLFAAAGGIAVKGTLAGTTRVNAALLFIGTILASWIGTTGAAMVMIRPLIRANEWRKYKVHIVVFFIFLVANIGGCLTPLGDPPLFMGFQRGVPFTWTFNLFPILVFNMILLFALFYFIDRHYYKKELAEGRYPIDELAEEVREPIRIEGLYNFIFIFMIIIGVVANGVLPKMIPAFADGAGIPVFDEIIFPYATLVEIIIILAASFLSLKMTKQSTRELNSFSHAPILEVAKLFIGIFITMIPALIFLKTHGAELGLNQPWQMFWAAGALSSFLDNTPTYLVFLQTAGALGATSGIATTVGTVAVPMLEAISAGAVFMGANTYIGNAPNFMVKSIAEENGIKMPSFFGYMGWSCAILIPTFIIDMLVFFL
ncbi:MULTISPECIES: sodium:proton antiporter [Megasphaera]|uniref:Putative membrane protein n=1 Tax=Megasphaera vaginalis (ex Srinivasan et al. 2021) TaxID=1111454 RepID=U7UDB8_9FIRM|nr:MULTISPECIES: sodium:proton antiporter [Megasphaera]ERT56448.1 putative membrane protein [Megasphaera vaginalis (ex Srinivasan et al. 2021)]